MKSTIFTLLVATASQGGLFTHAFSSSSRAFYSQRSAVKSTPVALRAALETPEGKATAVATGTVDAPIADVWAVLKEFDKLDTWWPIYSDFTSTGTDIGDTRTFGFQTRPGVVTTEELIYNGESSDGFAQSYKLDNMKNAPVPIDSVVTIVTLTPNGDSTDVKWMSWTKSIAASVIAPTQSKGYADGIAHLNKHFNPSLGTVDVTVVSAANLGDQGFYVRPYAVVAVDGAESQIVTSKERDSNPVFDQPAVTFEILKPGATVQVGIFDTNVGEDALIGTAELDIYNELESGKPVTKTFPLGDRPGATVTVEFELTVPEGGKLPPSKAQEELENLRALNKAIDSIKAKALGIQKEASKPEPAIWEYECKGGLPKSVVGLPASEVLPPAKVGLMIEAISEYAYTQFKLKQRIVPVAGSYDRYKAYFAPEGEEYVPIPDILKDDIWKNDEEFLRQVFSGLNPMQVKVCTSTDGIPDSLTSLKAKDGSDVAKLMDEGRLYLLDYPELTGIKAPAPGCVLYAPVVLIARTGPEDLEILGIVLEPERDGAPVYTPDSSTPNKYLFAKMHVACSDNQVHQFPYHLGFAHLGTEPMAIAAHNTLEHNDHALGTFLKIHFRGLVGINYLARQTLVAEEGAITDTTFATGTQQGVEMTIKKFADYYDFMEIGLPGEMALRGFDRTDDFKGYRFRDDGWLIWDALYTYAEDMVDELYDSDADVAADSVVQEWAAESADPEKADIKGFPSSISDKPTLIKCLTTIIWCCSALHSALNYDQYPYTATPINRAASIFGAVPDGPDDITTADILKAVPGGPDPMGLKLSLFQGLLSWLLSNPEPPVLSQVPDRIPNRNNPLKFVEFKSDHIGVYTNFANNLKEVEKIIDERNEGLTMPYTILKPSKIAASINI